MQALAIDDHVTSKLTEWYTIVSEWEPPGEGSTGICADCIGASHACIIDLAAWPHDVIHLLVMSLRTVVIDVQKSYSEENQLDAAVASAVATHAVTEAITRHAADIEDVLEQCLSERLQSYLTDQVELGAWDVAGPTAS